MLNAVFFMSSFYKSVKLHKKVHIDKYRYEL